jgi:hypothetical protein
MILLPPWHHAKETNTLVVSLVAVATLVARQPALPGEPLLLGEPSLSWQ